MRQNLLYVSVCIVLVWTLSLYNSQLIVFLMSVTNLFVYKIYDFMEIDLRYGDFLFLYRVFYTSTLFKSLKMRNYIFLLKLLFKRFFFM